MSILSDPTHENLLLHLTKYYLEGGMPYIKLQISARYLHCDEAEIPLLIAHVKTGKAIPPYGSYHHAYHNPWKGGGRIARAPMTEEECATCKEVKPITEFYNNRRTICKACQNLEQKLRRRGLLRQKPRRNIYVY